jgi:type VI secretion system VasD/TssJ family lipoprotein
MTIGRALVTGGLLAAMVTAPGCFCRKPPKPPEPPRPVARTLCLEASPRLNWYNGTANTLYVRLFQLSSLEAFQQADPARLLDPEATLAGIEGTPLERTIFPGTKVSLELRQQPDAVWLGTIAGYYKLSGAAKGHRALPPIAADGDEPPRKKKKGEQDPEPPCITFGPNGIEVP